MGTKQVYTQEPYNLYLTAKNCHSTYYAGFYTRAKSNEKSGVGMHSRYLIVHSYKVSDFSIDCLLNATQVLSCPKLQHFLLSRLS